MANRGVIGGRVTVGGSPTRARVALKDIRQGGPRRGGVSLPYYQYGTTNNRNIAAVYTDNKGRFKIFFSWKGSEIGEFLALPTFYVSVMETGDSWLHRISQGRCLVTTDLGKIVAQLMTTRLGISRAMAKYMKHVKWPSAGSSMTTGGNLSTENRILVGAVEVDF